MTILLVMLACLIVAAPARAQQADYPRMARLADGVFMYEQIDPTKRGVAVNNLIVVTTDGVLVADGQGTVDNTARLVADIATVTPQPIRYVVIGSIHGDHRGGDKAFPATVEFIKDKRSLTLGGRQIDVLFLGRSHTGVDLEVFLPKEKILYTSEIFSTRIFPSLSNGYPSEWVAALTRAEALDAEVYVPAHCSMALPKNMTRDEVRLYRSSLERVIAEGRRLHDAKAPVESAADGVDWGPFASWTRTAENAAGAVKRVYMELDGQLSK